MTPKRNGGQVARTPTNDERAVIAGFKLVLVGVAVMMVAGILAVLP